MKRGSFDICGGDCQNCGKHKLVNLSSAVVMVKRKVTKKYVPPELSALKILIDKDEVQKDLKFVSDEELIRLEAKLKNEFLSEV